MNIQKITNIISWTLGLLGLLFLFILIFQGDDSIEAAASILLESTASAVTLVAYDSVSWYVT